MGGRDLMAGVVTMTSREIAELVESRHDKVKQSIDRLAARGAIGAPPMGEYLDGLGRPAVEYRICKRDSYVIVAQLSPEFTAKLVDRWQELESKQGEPQFAVPTTLSGALRLAAEQAETIEAQAAQLEQAKPAVAFVDSYVTSTTGAKGFREVCKLLKANEAKFREFLIDKKIMYRLSGTLTPHAAHLDAGRFEVKAGTNGERAFNQARFTPKGVSWIAGEWAKFQIEGSAK